MTKIGYWASQEQYSMKDLLQLCRSSRKDGSLIKLLQVTIFILGHIIIVMVTLHGFG